MSSSKRGRVAAGAAAMALAGALYAGTLNHPPVWDDHSFVFGQTFMRDCANLGRALSPAAFTHVLPVRGAARPVWVASVLLDTCAGGGAIAAYRLSSLFWHAAGAAVVTALAWELAASLPACAAAGLLFAAHPVHVEAVNVITFRGDLLCLVFMALALLLYREAQRQRGAAAAGAAAGALAAAGLALLAKEMAVTLPALAALTDALSPVAGTPPARRRAWLLGAAALVGAYLVFRAPRSGYVMRGGEDAFSALSRGRELPFSRPLPPPDGGSVPLLPAEAPFDDPPWREAYGDPRARALTMSAVLGSELRLLLWPSRLQGDYAPEVVRSWRRWDVALAWAAWALLLAAAWRLRRAQPLASAGLAWAAVSLLPVSGLFWLHNLQAERYLYVPSAGVCLAAGAAFSAAWGKAGPRGRAAAAAALGALVVAGSARVLSRNADYASDEALLSATLREDPRVPRAHLGLASLAAERGQAPAAEAHFKAAIEAAPSYARARRLYAAFLARQGRASEAAEQSAAETALTASATVSSGRASEAGSGRRR